MHTVTLAPAFTAGVFLNIAERMCIILGNQVDTLTRCSVIFFAEHNIELFKMAGLTNSCLR